MVSLFLFTLFTFALGISVYVLRSRKHLNLPPGPSPLPIIGNLHQIGVEPHKAFKEMGKIYGNVIFVRMGSHRCVVLNDSKSIKEAFSNKDFSDRPRLRSFVDRTAGHSRGILFSSGRTWEEQRRFTLRSWRNFGYGKKSMEEMIQKEIAEVIEDFISKVGQPILMESIFNAPALNSLWHITTGERFEYNDPYFHEAVHAIAESLSDTGSIAGAYNFFPILAKYFPNWSGYNQMMSVFQKANDIVSTFMKKWKPLPQGMGEPRHLVDAYFQKVLKEKDPHSSFWGKDGESNLIYTLADLFLTGTETTGTVLSWAFFLLAHHQEEQRKLFAEIKTVVGLSRDPDLSDREKMPYAQAVILEVLRFSTVAPLGVPHCTSTDVKFRSYLIPKNTVVLSNIYAASRDECVWHDPDSFCPARFILQSGEVDIHNESFIIFSAGGRQCAGEKFARDELFLFVTTLFQKFIVSFDPSREPPAINENLIGLTNAPKPYYAVLKER